MKTIFGIIFIVFCIGAKGYAGEAHVLNVKIERMADNSLTVYATVQHDDEGWKHYADRWEILDMQGNLLDTRVLMHPHTEEPFTRSLPRVKIPAETKKIRVRAHDNIHGYGGREIVTEIPKL